MQTYRRHLWALAFCAVAWFALAKSAALADEIWLKKGKVVKGKIVRRTATHVEIQLQEGAVLKLPIDAVVGVKAESALAMARDKIKYHLRLKEYEKALALLDQSLQAHPGDAELTALRARAYAGRVGNVEKQVKGLLARDSFKAARTLAQQTRQEAPTAATRDKAHDLLAEIYLAWAADEVDHVRNDGAAEVLGEAVQSGISDARIHLLIAQMHEYYSRPRLAANEYQLALQLDQTLEEARRGLATTRQTIASAGPVRVDPLDAMQEMLELGNRIRERMIPARPPAVPPPNTPPKDATPLISAAEHARIAPFISPYNKRYDQYVAAAAVEHKLDPAWIKAIIQAESSFKVTAKSSAGARGLMQLMDGTARDMGVSDPLNPRQNIMGGAKYFRLMLDRFKQNPTLALAAYNAGPGTVQIYKGVPPYIETKNYIRKVMLYYQYFKYETRKKKPA